MRLCPTTRTAIGLSEKLDPAAAIPYISEAMTMLGSPSIAHQELEMAYLETALALTYVRIGGAKRYEAELHLQTVAAVAARYDRRLSLLAQFYRLVLQMVRGVSRKPDPTLPPVSLVALAQSFYELATATDDKLPVISGLCLSLAAECEVRRGGNPATVIEHAGRSTIILLYCEDAEDPRIAQRNEANSAMLSCARRAVLAHHELLELLDRPGELLAAA